MRKILKGFGISLEELFLGWVPFAGSWWDRYPLLEARHFCQAEKV